MASETGKIKRVFKGDKVSFDGTLLDDEAIRQIDIDLLQKDSCERQLATNCSAQTDIWGWEEFALGVIAGGLVVYGVSH